MAASVAMEPSVDTFGAGSDKVAVEWAWKGRSPPVPLHVLTHDRRRNISANRGRLDSDTEWRTQLHLLLTRSAIGTAVAELVPHLCNLFVSVIGDKAD